MKATMKTLTLTLLGDEYRQTFMNDDMYNYI